MNNPSTLKTTRREFPRRSAIAGLALGLWVLNGPGVNVGAAPIDDPQLSARSPNGTTIDFEKNTTALTERAPSGNPLWGVPLNSLSMTRERPIFSPTRRPPPVAVVPHVQPAIVQSEPPAPQQPPPLQLVGTIVGGNDGIAIFVESATRNVVRLRTGSGHAGWILRAVEARAATLQNGERTEVLALPKPSDQVLPAVEPTAAADSPAPSPANAAAARGRARDIETPNEINVFPADFARGG